MSDGERLLKEFERYLLLELNFSSHSIAAYRRDVKSLLDFLEAQNVDPRQATRDHIETYLAHVYDLRRAKTTQARMLSSSRHFFRFLAMSGDIVSLPTDDISAPRADRRLPDVLTLGEVDRILNVIDLSMPQGHRNRSIIETIYSCGLRVSEVTTLKLSDLILEERALRVTGKGDRQRIVPLSMEAIRKIELWLVDRNAMKIKTGDEDILYLNRRGGRLTRAMVFTLLREAVEAAGIDKTVSPHTLRHSFATHLLLGGADIRMVQELLGHESVTTTEIYTHLDHVRLSETLRECHPLAGRGKK